MANLISIPRQALADLLAAAGSNLTPEQYLASLPDMGVYKKYASRTVTAAWSKNILLLVAVLSAIWVCLPMGFSIEGVILAVGLGVVTFFEYRVHRYFRDLNPEAPSLGYRNQTCFATAILIYGLYHACLPFQLPVDTQALIEENNMIDPGTLRLCVQAFYVFIGALGFVSQYGLAWYYRLARAQPQA